MSFPPYRPTSKPVTALLESTSDRDTFAAHALGGIMAKMASTTMPAGTREQLAKLAYQMADAMLAARDRTEVVQ